MQMNYQQITIDDGQQLENGMYIFFSVRNAGLIIKEQFVKMPDEIIEKEEFQETFDFFIDIFGSIFSVPIKNIFYQMLPKDRTKLKYYIENFIGIEFDINHHIMLHLFSKTDNNYSIILNKEIVA